MNTLLEQLAQAQANKDESLVNLIKQQIAYINYEHAPLPIGPMPTNPRYYYVAVPKAGKSRSAREVKPTEVMDSLPQFPRIKLNKPQPKPDLTKLQENVAHAKNGSDVISSALQRLEKKKIG